MRFYCLILVAALLSACTPAKKQDPRVSATVAKETPASQVVLDPSETWVISPTTLTERRGHTTWCRLGNVSRFSVYPSGSGSFYGNCDQDIQIAEGPLQFIKLADGTHAGVFKVSRAKNGQFARVTQKYGLYDAVAISGVRPLHSFQVGGVHIAATNEANEASFREAVLNALPQVADRAQGQISGTLVPKCKANRARGRLSGGVVSLTCDSLKGRLATAEQKRLQAQQARIAAVNANLTERLRKKRSAEATPVQQTTTIASETTTSETVPGSPPLYEGSFYNAFTPQQIQSYCQQNWETRATSSGRTEYNPCKRRDAFN